MKQLIIFGNGDFARLLKYYIDEDDDREVRCFTVNASDIRDVFFEGLPVVPFEDIEKKYSAEEYEILLGIGNVHMNDTRKRIFEECNNKGFNVASFIHSSSKIHNLEMGEGTIILEDCLFYPFAKIGKGNLFWDHVLVSHDCEIGDFNTFSGSADMAGYVKVGNNGYFGKQCLLNDGIVVGDYVLVGACAYVKRNLKDYEVVVPPRSSVLENKKSTDLMYMAYRLSHRS
ncbi:MAG: acetyltransferase [Lachnospiraceae bacterium]|nr:acetyltransferase [Lachnospiraceae bacterium]